MRLNKYIEDHLPDSPMKRKIIAELKYRDKMLVCQYRMLGKNRYMICPTCKHDIEVEYTNFCSVCGQRLSWYGSVKHARPVN